MKYNFIETDDVIKSVLELNNITLDELNKEYDFTVKDEVFLKFKEELLKNKDCRFLIVGDYDCDGICATTIIKSLFNHLNISSNYLIPSRINQGYGLNDDIVKMAKDNNFDCLILVDNGIVAYNQIELANKLGIKVFVIDHHEYDVLPKCEAIIHSNIVSNKYSGLSAGGLAFVLSRSIYQDDLSLVLGGLSTLSDVMSVKGFNRYLIKEMMQVLKSNQIYQMNYLNDNNPFSYESLSFNVIPKINALSRMEPMGDANKLVQYFLADDMTCHSTIEQINYVNEKRRQYTKDMSKLSYELLSNDDIEVISSIKFMEGLCGLISNRLTHELNKPTIVLALKDGMFKGSARSINGFNLYEALKGFDSYETFGGHEGAVGLSLKEKNYQSFINYVRNIDINVEEKLDDVLLIEDNIINFDLLNKLNELEPFGPDFIKPFISVKNSNYQKIVISNRYPKFIIRKDLSAISFNERLKNKDCEYIVGTLRKDNYHKESLEILIEDEL